MRSASLLVSALVLACSPQGLGSNTEDGSTIQNGTDSTTDESTTGSESSTFVPIDAVGAGLCDPWQQDCPVGEKCVPYSSTGGTWEASKCVPVLGDQAPGEPCTYDGVVDATDDCDGTSHCWDLMVIDGQQVGTCAPFCTGTIDAPECPAGQSCIDEILNLCVKSCDPILQDCSPGFACYWAGGGDFGCFLPTLDIPAGQPCGYLNDCAAGLVCQPAEVLPACEGPECCAGFCDLNLGDGPCDELLAGTACVPFFEIGMAPPGYEHVGVCIDPP